MANYKVTDSELISIADAIRTKGGTSASLAFPSGFVSAIGDISASMSFSAADEGKVVSSGALSAQGIMSVVSNSVYDTTLFSQVSVAVPEATLVSKTISENGTYYPSDDSADAYSQVVVNVQSSGGGFPDFILDGTSGSFFNNTVSKIVKSAFYSHTGLTGIECTSCQSIASSVFMGCSNLEFASFPVCTSIGNAAFKNCKKLSEIYFPSLLSAGQEAFYNCGIKNVEIPSITTIINNMFGACVSLLSASFQNVTEIIGYAFNGCFSLENISIPKATILNDYCFSDCSKLQSIILPACQNIKAGCFSGCNALENITILLSSVCSLVNANAFQNTPISKSSYVGYFGSVYVPASLVDSYKTANQWSVYADRITAYVEE